MIPFTHNPGNKPSAEQMSTYFEPHVEEVEKWYCGTHEAQICG